MGSPVPNRSSALLRLATVVCLMATAASCNKHSFSPVLAKDGGLVDAAADAGSLEPSLVDAAVGPDASLDSPDGLGALDGGEGDDALDSAPACSVPCGPGQSCQSGVCSACGSLGQPCCGSAKGACGLGAVCNAGTKTCERDKAIDISGDSPDLKASTGTFCALFQSGRVRCWGADGSMLGIGSDLPSSVAAAPVTGLDDATHVSVGPTAVCAARALGSVVCWGHLPGLSSGIPVEIPGVSLAKQVSVGLTHACARTANGKAMCWGSNGRGELGTGVSGEATQTAVAMQNATDVQTVAAAHEATCVLRKDGKVSCTGARDYSGFGADSATLIEVPAAFNTETLVRSGVRFCAISQANALLCWGVTAPGGGRQPWPLLTVTGSLYTFMALDQDHSVWVNGGNWHGEIGDGTFTNLNRAVRSRFIHAPGFATGVVAIATTSSYESPSTCVLRNDGSVFCAGFGSPGLGDGQVGPPVDRTPYVPVVGILPVGSEDGQCYDGVDNDGDGKSDLDDSDCAQDLASAIGDAVATGPFAGLYGNYLQESCNGTGGSRYGGSEAVFVWTAPSPGAYRFDTSGSSFDTVLAATKGNPTTTDELGCNDDGSGLSSGASALDLQLAAGQKIVLIVDSKGQPNTSATFTVNVTKL